MDKKIQNSAMTEPEIREKFSHFVVEVDAAGRGGKWCSDCGRYLELEASFHRKASTADGFKGQCKLCMKVYQVTHADVMRRARDKYERRRRNFVAGVGPDDADAVVDEFIQSGEVLPLRDDEAVAALDAFLEGDN